AAPTRSMRRPRAPGCTAGPRWRARPTGSSPRTCSPGCRSPWRKWPHDGQRIGEAGDAERGPLMARAWAEIDLAAVRHNVAALREHVAPARVCGVVKANGYGHGAVAVG